MKTVFILGAGFTKSYAPAAPLLCDDYKVDELIKNFRGFSWAKKILELEIKLNEGNEINLERLMTRLEGQMPYDFEGEAKEQFALLLSQLKIRLKGRLGQIRNGEIFENDLDKFARNCVENKNDCITFNYDDLLDEALTKTKPSLPPGWHPDGGYGFFCRPALEMVTKHNAFMDQTNMFLYKLHGSVNWRPIRGSSQPVAINDIVHQEPWLSENYRKAYERLAGGPISDSVIESHLNPEPFIVPPILVKTTLVEQPILRLIWSLAYKILQEAESVFFLGYSLPITDIAAGFLFSEGLSNLDQSRIKIVNKPKNEISKNEIQGNYRRIFPRLKENQFVNEDIRTWVNNNDLPQLG